jgi:proline dehydrogenase
MSILNKIIVGTIPLVPKAIVRKFANRYIAGAQHSDAVEVTKRLNGKGMMVTLDVLGEDVFSKADALKAKDECLKVLDEIAENNLNANQSLKLTSLGLKIDYDFCLNNLEEILSKAQSLNQFVRLDMEDSSCTSGTIGIYEDSKKKFSKTGIVIQAYLRRSYDDVSKLVKSNSNFRLCKGIYIEPEEIAFKDKKEIQQSYLNLLRLMMESNCYVGIATHDDVLIDGAYKLIEELKKKKDEYEFQMLLGVRENLRDKILKDGHRLRIYVPFGTHWYQYSIRRFKENPQMAGYVFKSIFTGGK